MGQLERRQRHFCCFGLGVVRGMGVACVLGVDRGSGVVRGLGVVRGMGVVRGLGVVRGPGVVRGLGVGAACVLCSLFCSAALCFLGAPGFTRLSQPLTRSLTCSCTLTNGFS